MMNQADTVLFNLSKIQKSDSTNEIKIHRKYYISILDITQHMLDYHIHDKDIPHYPPEMHILFHQFLSYTKYHIDKRNEKQVLETIYEDKPLQYDITNDKKIFVKDVKHTVQPLIMKKNK